MSRLLPLALVPLALGLAWLVRAEVGGPARGSDEETAAHLRRIELALIEQEVAVADGWVDPPRGASLPAPPFFDGVLATLARRLWGGGEGELGGLGERELERGLAHYGPLCGMLGALAVALLALALVRDEWSGFAALLAAALFALWPGAIEVGAAGRLSADATSAVLFALVAAVVAQTATSRDSFDWLQGGMSAGLFCALLLLISSVSLLIVPFAAVGFWVLMTKEVDERRRAARRAGLFFALTAALITALAAGRMRGDGPAAAWVRGASELAFAAGAPFLIPAVFSRERRGRGALFARVAGAVVALALAPLALWNMWPVLNGVVARWWAAPSVFPGPVELPFAVLVLLGTGLLARDEAWTVRGLALVTAVVTAFSLMTGGAQGPAAALGCALLAVAATRLPERGRVPLGAAAVLLLGGLAFVRRSPEHDPLVDALRLARRIEPVEVWRSSRSTPRGSWLAPWTLGHRVAHLARRPPTASGYGASVAPERVRAAALALTAEDESDLAVAMGGLGARYVLGGRIVAQHWGAVEALAGPAPFEATALGRLSRGAPAGGSRFARVLSVGDAAEPDLVVLALVSANADERPAPTLEAR